MLYPRSFMLSIFQSTLSVRRATRAVRPPVAVCFISIHALRKESDDNGSRYQVHESYFNPRSP